MVLVSSLQTGLRSCLVQSFVALKLGKWNARWEGGATWFCDLHCFKGDHHPCGWCISLTGHTDWRWIQWVPQWKDVIPLMPMKASTTFKLPPILIHSWIALDFFSKKIAQIVIRLQLITNFKWTNMFLVNAMDILLEMGTPKFTSQPTRSPAKTQIGKEERSCK